MTTWKEARRNLDEYNKATIERQHRERLEREAKKQTQAIKDIGRDVKRASQAPVYSSSPNIDVDDLADAILRAQRREAEREEFERWASTPEGQAELRRREEKAAAEERDRRQDLYAIWFPFQMAATAALIAPLGFSGLLSWALVIGLVAVLVAFYRTTTHAIAMLVMVPIWSAETLLLSRRILFALFGWPATLTTGCIVTLITLFAFSCAVGWALGDMDR